MEGKLRTNVIKNRYTFCVVYDDKDNEEITVEAESVGAAALMLPNPHRAAVLLDSASTSEEKPGG